MSRHVVAQIATRTGARPASTGPRALRLVAALGALIGGLGACSPVFDWREARPADGVLLLFPCKPDRATRQVAIAGAPQAMTLWSCSTGGLTFALSQVEATDAARVDALLLALRGALSTNLGATQPAASRVEDARVAGATPHPLAQRLVLQGRRGDGRSIEAQGQFFCQGLRVYQATVIGDRLDPQALETFFSSLKLTG